MSDEHITTLNTTIVSLDDHALAVQYAPQINFDVNEPFFPNVLGYTLFRESASSPSFPREIEVADSIDFVIEYAVWWDWDIGHLYELEHIWVYVDNGGEIVHAEASWHGGYNDMLQEDGTLQIENDRLVIYSEPGKHAFAPSPQWLLDRKERTTASCGIHAGKMGVHVTPLFNGIIQDRTPLNNRLVHTFLERHQFAPTFDFWKTFCLREIMLVPWQNLYEWIPKRMQWWTHHLQETIAPHEQRVLRIAHRGASAYAQENSAESMHKAVELGSDMVEVDIRITADDVPVITHDSSLKRIYGIDGNVSEFTLEELRSFDSASSQLMTFDELLGICRSLGLGLYLDIKEINREAASKIIAALDEKHYIKNTIFGSFRPDYLADLKAARPDLSTSILFGAINIDPVKLAQSINADYVHPCWERRAEEPHKLLTPEWIASVRAANLGIVCWHEERPSEIAALQALGVDAICSDQPELLIPTPIGV